MKDDINFPSIPEKINLTDYDGGDRYEDAHTEFRTSSPLPIKIDTDEQRVTEADFDIYNLPSLEKKVLIDELSSCDMYLNNIHKGFGHVGSTNSLIKLVMAGIGVHRHRRQVLKDLKAVGKKDLEFDDNGNVS